MEAPDKIYLQHNTTTDLYDEFWPEWFEGTHHPDRDICYIRKDALLEWAKEMLHKVEGKANDGDVFSQGMHAGFGAMISKLTNL